jgi:DNA polymerase-1
LALSCVSDGRCGLFFENVLTAHLLAAAEVALGRPKDDPRPSTVLIDGSPLIFRAHFGIDTVLTRKDGTIVTAVFGFTRMLLKLREAIGADYVGLFLDDKSPTFRKEMYAEYKAHRKALPDLLISQLPLVEEASRACGIYTMKLPGFEADDLIATYTRLATEQGHRVTVVSPDKDMMQLVTSPQVTVYDPGKRMLFDEESVKARWGIGAALIPQVQALTGDKSDNIPGASGIGPKIAAKLLDKYGSIEQLRARVEEEPKRIQKILSTYASEIDMSLKLATLNRNVPVPPLERLKLQEVEKERLFAFLRENGFYSILNHVFGATYSAPATPKQVQTARERMLEIKGTTIVYNRETALPVIEKLMKMRGPGFVHACDTEVIGIDLSVEGPVGHGRIICASLYSGPEHDFGNGPRVWIDNLDDAEGTLDLFKEFLESADHFKAFHNVGFDRHVFFNHGIDVKGFAGDTMHMARLWNSSRRSYSLETLSEELLTDCTPKVGMKTRFGQTNTLTDGTPGKELILPPLETVQRDADMVVEWIDYSTLDAEATFKLYRFLKLQLQELSWHGTRSQWDFYWDLWRPFGELLTDVEREGIFVDREHLRAMETKAVGDELEHQQRFVQWASQFCPEARLMNPKSTAQKQQFFFAPSRNSKTGEEMPAEREFSTENEDGYVEPGKSKALKTRHFMLRGLGMPPVSFNASGWPSCGQADLLELVGPDVDHGVYGRAHEFFGGGEKGATACRAIDDLLESSRIDTLLSNFLVPLQNMLDANGRVHAAMNLWTETGRLSCRRPNLQNQPSLEKDRYRVRQAFRAAPGKKLIVADYGQLELRLLAHVSNCKSMLDAFEKGGDFHSRTAIGMYEHVRKAVEKNEVLLEWDASKGKPTKPLLKDAFASERRKAKTLNFSIAYGKTARGLSKDWGVTLADAEETLERWFADRPEVRAWQKRTIESTRETGCTTTLMGRRRPLPEITSPVASRRSAAERAAINTPLQGGAADLVMKAMLLLHSHAEFRRLGWKLLLQIHDELIVEGPEETVDEAMAILLAVMKKPFQTPLRVELVVEAKKGDDWFSCK